MNTKGMIAIAIAKKPNNEFAQLIPNLEYMLLVAMGRNTAIMDLDVLAAATAEAENCLYASVR